MLYDSKGNEIASPKTTYDEMSEKSRRWVAKHIEEMLKPSFFENMLPLIHKANGKDMHERTVKMNYKSGLKFRRPVAHEVK